MSACSHDQLEQLERSNKKLDSERFWEGHCKREHHVNEKTHSVRLLGLIN